jgi:glutamyl-Q tRNA(Asp) synthetase
VTSNQTDGAASAPFSVVGRKPLNNPLARFAPSPTGPLHQGSLLAAVGSYLDARTSGAGWLVRVEDLDTARVIPGCADTQLRTLEACGFEWDGEVLFQSTRRAAYLEALAALSKRTFPCSCSRKDLAADDDAGGYPGTCREGPSRPGPTALRFRVSDVSIHFDDLFLGSQDFDLATLGDVVVQRRDGIASYQLAVVVDDAFQGVTRVVRGADLLASTPWQIDLQRALSLPTPIYGHLPLLVEADGAKLSKSNRAVPIDPSSAPEALTSTLTHLSQAPPPDLAHSSIKDVWNWAFAHWRPQALAGKTESRCQLKATTKQNRRAKIVGCKKVY